MSDFKRRYLKRLKSKSRYVNLEYEETLELYKMAKMEFVSAIHEYASRNNKANPLQSSEVIKEKTLSSLTDDEIKRVYRNIARKTHPDKLHDCDNDELRAKTEIYDKAIRARNENDIDTLLRLASDLEIEMGEMSINSLESLEKQINDKEKEIESMHKDIAWVWYYSNSLERKNILDNIFKSV